MQSIIHQPSTALLKFLSLGNAVGCWSDTASGPQSLKDPDSTFDRIAKQMMGAAGESEKYSADHGLRLYLLSDRREQFRRAALKALLADKPKEFQNYIIAGVVSPKDEIGIWNSWQRYVEFYNRAHVLSSLLDYKERLAEHGSGIYYESELMRGTQEVTFGPKSLRCELVKDLVVEEFNPERLGRCKNCQQIFWTARLRALYCSTRCSSAMRQRRLRQRRRQTEKKTIRTQHRGEE